MTKIYTKDRCETRDVRDIALLDFLKVFHDVEENESSAIEFLTKPRSFLAARGLFVPFDTRLTTTPTEEYRAKLVTKEGLEDFISKERAETAKIKIHVKTGLAECARIEFECPKKKGTSENESSSRNIASDMSIREFSMLIGEVEKSDSAADELLCNPRQFFEQRGLFAPPNTKFHVTPTEMLRASLSTERGIDAFLDQQAAASFEVHVKEGKGKCVKVTIECDK